MKVIYDYYVYGKDNIKDIVEVPNSELYKQWLHSFHEEIFQKGTWGCFVEKNYLQDFVDCNTDGSYGMPKELWAGHFGGEILPAGMVQIEQFFVNASCWIMARGTRMLLRLRKIFMEKNT